MRFIILNGSPKTVKSVTMQSINYIEKNFTENDFEYVHIISEIKKYEKDPSVLKGLCEKIEASDAVIWAFPIYHILVPAHYKRFIELIFANKFQSYFKGKYTAVFSTSVHYADNNAHDYMHGICDDLQMNYVDSLSHHMDDLLVANRRKELLLFWEEIIMNVDQELACSIHNNPLKKSDFHYIASEKGLQIEMDKKIIIVTDASSEDNNLNEMIKRFNYVVAGKTEVLNFNDIDIKGYCMGCCKCGTDNICAYKDGYREFLDYVKKEADIIIYAGTIRDRYLSSKFKLYYDRSFTYNHVPLFPGKQIGYMISGNMSSLHNLRQIFEYYNQEVTNMAGIISDESENNNTIDNLIYSLVSKAKYFSENSYIRPANFLGIGGMSIFSEMIKGFKGAIFLADYRYFKKKGYLSNKISMIKRIGNALMRYFMGKKRFSKEVQKHMYENMISAHRKVISMKTK